MCPLLGLLSRGRRRSAQYPLLSPLVKGGNGEAEGGSRRGGEDGAGGAGEKEYDPPLVPPY